MAPLALLAGSVLAVGAGALAVLKRKNNGSADKDRSTTSSAGGGPSAYETKRAVDEYVQFHFGKAEDLLPYECGPKGALDFMARCAELVEKHCESLRDFNGESNEQTAMDLGCAVGGASFELARAFPHVLGIDYSHAFVDAAKKMQREGSWEYEAVVEGEIRQKFMASVPEEIDRSRVKFMQGDACALSADLRPFDAILAANLLCRLPEPMKFLDRAKDLVKPGGVLVLVSPYSWLPGWTPKEKWLGGFYDTNGVPVRTASNVASALMPHFEAVAQQEMPFLIREHARKFQWGCSHAVVWKRRADAAK